ncbi:hypothetical protein [Achromobacter insolitus]|uniref:hypothetical protein n=1 Tax=Achromobacter insolitus TaxID=217204 RepID=UPI00366D55F9
MTENPFGDDTETAASEKPEKRQFLVLLSASKDSLSMTQSIVQNLKKDVDPKSNPLWIDSKGIGILVETELVAASIWNRALAGLDHERSEALKDMLILEVGQDWMARKDAAATHWLTTHVGYPRIVPRDQIRRR